MMKRRLTLGLSLLYLLLSHSAHAYPNPPAPTEPIRHSDVAYTLQRTDQAAYPPLRATRDAALQQALERSIRELGLSTAIKRRQLGVALVDITEPNRPRLAELNGDTMFYAASLPKIAILWGVFQRVAEGALKLDEETHEALIRMIRRSSNRAATQLLNQVGKAYLAELLQSPPYKFYDPEYGGGLWVGKEYAKTGAWQRDPLHQISHGATALQVARFYYYLETGRLVSPSHSQAMKAILADSAINHKFVRGLKTRYPDARLYRKSGTWRNAHADSALIEHDGRRYIAVALVNNPRGGDWLQRLIVELDGIILERPAPTRTLARGGSGE